MLEYGFDSLIKDESNEKAYSEIQKLLDMPEACPDLLWITGPFGCGKTHLMKSAFRILEERGGTTPFFSYTEPLLCEMKGFGRENENFRGDLEQAGVIFLAYVDALKGGTEFQAELAQLLLYRIKQGAKVVVSSFCPAKELNAFLTTLEQGTINLLFRCVDYPTDEAKRVFARRYLEEHPFPVSAAALEYIACHSVCIPELCTLLGVARFYSRNHGERKTTLPIVKRFPYAKDAPQ